MSGPSEAPMACHDSAAQSLQKLAELAEHVLYWESGHFDVDSDQARRALTLFLGASHSTGHRLQVPQAARGYREALSDRVRASWTDAECLYHIGVLTKSVHGEVYLNSRAYQLSEDAAALSCQLAVKLGDLLGLLGRLRGTGLENVNVSDVEDVKASLTAFDWAWASFEELFFVELSLIEAKARAVLVEAVGLVKELDRIAGNYEEDADPREFMKNPEFLEKHNGLIDCVAQLYAEAHPGVAARSFSPSVLQQSEAAAEACLSRGDRKSSVFVIASSAIIAWDHLCCYLFEKEHCVHEFSPNIRRNRELVALLEGWASSWGLAEAYVVDDKGRLALQAIVQYVRQAKTVAPALAGMIDDQSAELFLVLPRLVLVCFLEDAMRVEPILAELLPHRFEQIHDDRGVYSWPSSDLAAFMDLYRRTWNQLVLSATVAPDPGRGDAQAVLQAVLISSLVGGVVDGSVPATQGAIGSPSGAEAREAWKSFALRLEGWSMELQRHCARDWNHFSSTLLRCLEP